jgi:hypothetical protein
MCYERSDWRRRAEDEESRGESRRFWELFRRETAEPPAREPATTLEGEDVEAERPAEPVGR